MFLYFKGYKMNNDEVAIIKASVEFYRKALISIAEHYEFCDLTNDSSSQWVVRKAARTLGWTISEDEFGQIVYEKGVDSDAV
jgi:hypothetical protein